MPVSVPKPLLAQAMQLFGEALSKEPETARREFVVWYDRLPPTDKAQFASEMLQTIGEVRAIFQRLSGELPEALDYLTIWWSGFYHDWPPTLRPGEFPTMPELSQQDGEPDYPEEHDEP